MTTGPRPRPRPCGSCPTAGPPRPAGAPCCAAGLPCAKTPVRLTSTIHVDTARPVKANRAVNRRVVMQTPPAAALMIAGSYLRRSALLFCLQIFNESLEAKDAWADLASAHAVGECSAGEEQPTSVPLSTSAANRAVLPYDTRCARRLPEKAREFRPVLKRRFENSLCLMPFFAMWPVVPLGDVVRRNGACSRCCRRGQLIVCVSR